MKIIRLNREVLFTDEDITKVTARDLEFLKNESLSNERKRIRLCAHKDTDDKVQEMIIVHSNGVYVRPHKHLGRSESLHVIEGEAYAFMFDDNGKVLETIHMGDKKSGLAFYYRISKAVFHNLLIISDFFVFHEAVGGPFDKSKTVFAYWAPQENEYGQIEKYSRNLRENLNVKKED